MEPFNTSKNDRLDSEQTLSYAGEPVNCTSALKKIAEKINDTENWNDDFIPVVFTNADRKISGLQYYSKAFFENESDKVKNELEFSAIEAGAIGAFPVITDGLWSKLSEGEKNAFEAKLKEHVENSAFTDAAFNKSTITDKYSIEAGKNYYDVDSDSSERKIDISSTWSPRVNTNLFPEEPRKQNNDIER